MPHEYKPPTDHNAAIMEIHRALYEPQQGMPPRLDQIDALLKITRSSKGLARILLWLGGGGLAMIGAYRSVADAIAKVGGGQ